jgi:hypothetical protein
MEHLSRAKKDVFAEDFLARVAGCLRIPTKSAGVAPIVGLMDISMVA